MDETILETERLLLNEATLKDAQFCFDLMNSPKWLKYIGDRSIKSIADAEAYIQNSLIQSYRENGFGLYKMVLKAENKPIGLCGLLKRPHLEHPDIGFAQLPDYEGKGYMFEVAQAIMKYANTQLGMETILAVTDQKNKSSQKLLEKIGLHFVKYIKWKDEQDEVMLYSSQRSNSRNL